MKFIQGQNFRGILMYTINSALRSRFLYIYLIATLIGLAMVYGIAAMGAKIQMSIADEVYNSSARNSVNYFCSILTFLTVFASSRIFPRILDPGLAGFFFCRPYSRSSLLAISSISLALVFSAMILFCGGIFVVAYVAWAPVSLSPSALFTQLALETLIFLVYVPVVMFFSVFSRSGSYAFLGSFAIWLVAYILAGRSGLLRFIGNDLTEMVGDTLYYVLPKSSEIADLFGRSGSESLMPIWSSVLFAVCLYALADWKIRRIEL